MPIVCMLWAKFVCSQSVPRAPSYSQCCTSDVRCCRTLNCCLRVWRSWVKFLVFSFLCVVWNAIICADRKKTHASCRFILQSVSLSGCSDEDVVPRCCTASPLCSSSSSSSSGEVGLTAPSKLFLHLLLRHPPGKPWMQNLTCGLQTVLNQQGRLHFFFFFTGLFHSPMFKTLVSGKRLWHITAGTAAKSVSAARQH